MPRRPVDRQALRLEPITVNKYAWYYEDKKGINLYFDIDKSHFVSGGIAHTRIPYKLLAETISRAWGIELRARKRGE